MIEIYFLLYVVRSHVPSQANIHMGPRSDIFCTMTDFNRFRRSFILAPLLLHHTNSFSTGCVPLAWCLSQLHLLSGSTFIGSWWFFDVVQEFYQSVVRHGQCSSMVGLWFDNFCTK